MAGPPPDRCREEVKPYLDISGPWSHTVQPNREQAVPSLRRLLLPGGSQGPLLPPYPCTHLVFIRPGGRDHGQMPWLEPSLGQTDLGWNPGWMVWPGAGAPAREASAASSVQRVQRLALGTEVTRGKSYRGADRQEKLSVRVCFLLQHRTRNVGRVHWAVM